MSTWKAISLWQPWAQLIQYGLKRYETRSWPTGYRGPLVIQASKRCMDSVAREVLRQALQLKPEMPDLPGSGILLCTCRLVDCVPAEVARLSVSEQELMFGDFTAGRWAWKLDDVTPFPRPLPWKGSRGFFNVEIP